jgi:hypothetical protein
VVKVRLVHRARAVPGGGVLVPMGSPPPSEVADGGRCDVQGLVQWIQSERAALESGTAWAIDQRIQEGGRVVACVGAFTSFDVYRRMRMSSLSQEALGFLSSRNPAGEEKGGAKREDEGAERRAQEQGGRRRPRQGPQRRSGSAHLPCLLDLATGRQSSTRQQQQQQPASNPLPGAVARLCAG